MRISESIKRLMSNETGLILHKRKHKPDVQFFSFIYAYVAICANIRLHLTHILMFSLMLNMLMLMSVAKTRLYPRSSCNMHGLNHLLIPIRSSDHNFSPNKPSHAYFLTSVLSLSVVRISYMNTYILMSLRCHPRP